MGLRPWRPFRGRWDLAGVAGDEPRAEEIENSPWLRELLAARRRVALIAALLLAIPWRRFSITGALTGVACCLGTLLSAREASAPATS